MTNREDCAEDILRQFDSIDARQTSVQEKLDRLDCGIRGLIQERENLERQVQRLLEENNRTEMRRREAADKVRRLEALVKVLTDVLIDRELRSRN